MTDKEVYEYHGWKEQCKHITSELHELTSAIYEFELTDSESRLIEIWDNMCEEVADMEFMLNQIKEYYSLAQEKINSWKDYKRKRESKRIKEGYYGK